MISFKRKLVWMIVLVIVTGISIVRYDQINRKYPNPRIIETGCGETGTCFNTEIEIMSGTFRSYEELEADSVLRSELSEDMKVLEVRMRLKAKEDTEVPLFRMAAQNGLMVNNPMYIMMLELYDGTRIQMKQGEEQEIVLYYSFLQSSFYEKDWDRMETEKWKIEMVDTYPYRYLMEIPT